MKIYLFSFDCSDFRDFKVLSIGKIFIYHLNANKYLSMNNDITPVGKLSQKEAIKSIRDAIIMASAILLPQILEILSKTDFGDYQLIVSIILGLFFPLINRWLNIVRV